MKLPGSVSSSDMGSVLVCVLGSVLEKVLRADISAYSHTGWECPIEYNWGCTSECTQECT